MLFSQNSVPVPDFSNGTNLLYWENARNRLFGVLSAYAYAGMQDFDNNTWTITDNQYFIVPKDGYVIAAASCEYKNDAHESLFVNLAPAGTTAWRNIFLVNYTKDIGAQSFSMYIPVSTGDKIATGIQAKNQNMILPPWCSIVYYPIKLKDASSI